MLLDVDQDKIKTVLDTPRYILPCLMFMQKCLNFPVRSRYFGSEARGTDWYESRGVESLEHNQKYLLRCGAKLRPRT